MAADFNSRKNYHNPNNNGCDWICDSCSNINFARRNTCNRCDKKRPSNEEGSRRKIGAQIGKNIAEKSHGLFSAEDWQCHKCANVNWARRNTCNMCNVPRFSEVEQRTGYGGGFNEREKVEYKERNDDEEDYDEFGRRKKKRHHSRSNCFDIAEYSKKSKSSSRSPQEKLAKTKDEKALPKTKECTTKKINDEEDDDDDADLSKYDLWGSDDDDTNK